MCVCFCVLLQRSTCAALRIAASYTFSKAPNVHAQVAEQIINLILILAVAAAVEEAVTAIEKEEPVVQH